MDHPSPKVILPLLHCPLCSSSRHLTDPTTLRCGHTVCSSHMTSDLCPIPTCSSTPPSFTPTIPSGSRVAFFPAITDSRTSPPEPAERRIDVKVRKLVELVMKAAEDEVEQSDHLVDIYSDSGDDSDDEQQEPVASPSSPSSTDRPVTPVSGSSPTSTGSSRPRKRRRRHTSNPRLPDFHPSDPEAISLAEFDKSLTTELTCEICFMLLYQPITTPCQHTFCSKCLQRSLDHSLLCPLCRVELPGFTYFHEHSYNKVVLALLLKAYPESYDARGQAIATEERDARLDTPIFVCQLSFPGMPTLLHFFEPRYRLMLRRCLEAPTPTLGMIMPPRAAPVASLGVDAGADFGTMLEIRSVQMLPDGRSMVETRGTHRFRILERGSLDGYMIGRVERIDDYEDLSDDWESEIEENADSSSSASSSSASSASGHAPSSPHLFSRIMSNLSSPSPTNPPLSTAALLQTCHTFLEQLRAGTAPWVVQRLNHTYGPQPPDENPDAFSFWIGMVLPIDEHEKAKLLPIKSARLRLRMVVGWIEQLNSNWWFSRGCIVI
ncbi:PUA-like domain-containing protein [Suillus fuscotomentosus]|uniref:PUA-like domain-containing protein n=1 Tax=Suillus fuscotomentosus TaxID=1912939 RepID=A0AAD4HSJ0_9AGAM|nr:PUA-like domain-containing protein [Suillus fuscotomentosus]KAG1907167.1 PUA-like domain-containing protein [Suillus fuscotomentosus]